MKFFVLLSFLSLTVIEASSSLSTNLFDVENEKENYSLLSSAVESILTKLFELNGEVVVANAGIDKNIIESIVMKSFKNQNVPFTYINFEMECRYYDVESSAIIFVDSINSLSAFNSKAELLNVFPKPFHLFLLCLNVTFDEILSLKTADIVKRKLRQGIKIYPNEMAEILQFEYFVLEEQDAVRLLTFVWYTPEKCSEPQLIEVNRFDKQSRKWKNSVFVTNKFENFHGCHLVFGVWQQGAAMRYEIVNNKHVNSYGFQLKIVEGLARSLNFTLTWNPLIYGKSFDIDYFYKNSSVDLMPWMTCYNNYGLGENAFRFITQPYLFQSNNMAVPPGEEFTGYEKLLLPFDSSTWLLISVTFVIAYSTIFVVNLSSIRVKNYIFGTNVSTPSLNVAAIFFGISQHVSPRRNFARFLAMLFVMFSLIIRTAWQGKMFEYLQKNITKSEVQTIEEMIQRNFTFYMLDQFENNYEKIEFLQR